MCLPIDSAPIPIAYIYIYLTSTSLYLFFFSLCRPYGSVGGEKKRATARSVGPCNARALNEGAT